MQEANKVARPYVLTAGGDEHPGRLSNIQEEDEIQSKKSRSVQQSIEAQENQGVKFPEIRQAPYVPVNAEISELVIEQDQSKSESFGEVEEYLRSNKS